MSNNLREIYETARAARKKLEAEFDELPALIETATRNGDATELIRLRHLKLELPAHFAAASKIENDAREAYLRPLYEEAHEQVRRTGDEIENLKQRQFELELAHKKETDQLALDLHKMTARLGIERGQVTTLKEQIVNGQQAFIGAVDRVIAA